jgi:hypothetical protein
VPGRISSRKNKSLSSIENGSARYAIQFRRSNQALQLELKSKYATQSFLDHLFGRRNDSGLGLAAVVGAGCHGSDWLSLLVGGVPQRLVLIHDPLPRAGSPLHILFVATRRGL